MILPWLALFSAGIAEHPASDWWYSISATYYQSPALVGILTAAAIVLITYDGYDWRDNLITTLSGAFGLGIVLFPCSVSWIDSSTRVGFFQLPEHMSNLIHCGCAGVFFVLLSINCLFLFTLGEKHKQQKKKRNRVYIICGLGMLLTMILFVLLQKYLPGWCVMITEIILLQFFGISWLTKGGCFFKD